MVASGRAFVSGSFYGAVEATGMNGIREIQHRTLVSGERSPSIAGVSAYNRYDLTRTPWLRSIMASRWPIFLVRSITLAGFLFTILAGLFGSPVGSHNFAIIFVWIAWWTALKLAFIPLGGRSWCSVCPLPMPGEWLQQGGLVSKAKHRTGFGLRWPRRLRGYWLQTGLFLLIGLFSAATLTNARLTAWILLGLIFLAVFLSLVFERRAFCSNICPIGGFTGIYAQTAPLEVRVKDQALCAAHNEKTCYIECPWGIYPLALHDSSACGLCMECLRVCPKDNIALNVRPFGSDLGAPRRTIRLDEAFLALVMLGSALAFSAVFTGPWSALKMAAFRIGSIEWLVYAGSFLALNLLVLPGLFALAAGLGRKFAQSRDSLRQAIANQAQALLPLGLFTWIAFTVSFAFPKFGYVSSILSDPFGWGWNLIGTANVTLPVGDSGVTLFLQVTALLVGLTWSAELSMRITGADRPLSGGWRQSSPVIVFCLAYTLGMLWLLVG
jgi:polyferredoxin